MLVAAGHEVTGTTQHSDKMMSIRSAGATPLLMNALHEQEVLAAVQKSQPEIIIHQLTAIPPNLDLRHFDQAFELTNRLRIEGTDHLLSAARRSGVRRFIAQSYAGWYARTGSWIKTEDDALISDGISDGRKTLDATIHVESAVLGEKAVESFVLRYGSFYGPGTSLAPGGWFFEGLKRARVPIVGKGTGHWSFIHIDDAAAATLAAIEATETGVYNISDNEPAAVSMWLPLLAEILGARAPRHVPKWLARMAVGEYGVAAMTELRGASNRKAKSQLGVKLQWPSWRVGFKHGFEDPVRRVVDDAVRVTA